MHAKTVCANGGFGAGQGYVPLVGRPLGVGAAICGFAVMGQLGGNMAKGDL